MMYQWAFTGLGKLGWFVAFIYTATTALRLARFNTSNSDDKAFFTGLPSPSAAAILAATLWVIIDSGYQGSAFVWPIALLTVLVGLLMVSNIRYYSFKDIDFKGKVPFISAVIIMLGFAVLLTKPAPILFTLFMAYGLSGPVMALYRLRRRQQRKARQ
jgi:CDP-diacylglycerol--serine O-phosphatidyltransferase